MQLRRHSARLVYRRSWVWTSAPINQVWCASRDLSTSGPEEARGSEILGHPWLLRELGRRGKEREKRRERRKERLLQWKKEVNSYRLPNKSSKQQPHFHTINFTRSYYIAIISMGASQFFIFKGLSSLQNHWICLREGNRHYTKTLVDKQFSHSSLLIFL